MKELQPCREDVEPRCAELWGLPELRDSQRLRVGLALLPFAPETVRSCLVAFMLEAQDPQEVILLRDGLAPFAAELRQEPLGQV